MTDRTAGRPARPPPPLEIGRQTGVLAGRTRRAVRWGSSAGCASACALGSFGGVGVGESMDSGAWFSHFWKPDFSAAALYRYLPNSRILSYNTHTPSYYIMYLRTYYIWSYALVRTHVHARRAYKQESYVLSPNSTKKTSQRFCRCFHRRLFLHIIRVPIRTTDSAQIHTVAICHRPRKSC